MLKGTHALLFTGIYEHAIDAKQRLAIPSDIRDRLNASQDGQAFYVTVGEGPTLCVYTERGFERRAEELETSELTPDEVLEYEQVLFGLSRRVELDKQGRIRIPEQLLRMADPGKEVILLGAKDHLQVHPRTWLEQMNDKIAARPELLRNPRRVMRKRQNDQENG